MPASPYRIILNDRCLRNPRTGIGYYVTELMATLREQAPDVAVTPFYTKYRRVLGGGKHKSDIAAGDGDRTSAARRWPGWLRRSAQGIYDWAFAAAASWGRFQLYHEPNYIPVPWNGPTITTVCDLSVLRHPEWHPKDRVQWYEREFSASLPRSQHFITISEFTKREMMDVLNIPAERITVTLLAARDLFRPRPREKVRHWLAENGWPNDYILYVGTIEPRKNLEGVLAAFSQLPVALRQRTSLLVVGLQGWGNERVRERVEHYGLHNQVRFPGYMTDEQLSYLYCGARLLLWPTFYEGFGLPPLECMASGTPVISSNCSSIPEVVGDAGILVDPRDTPKIGEAIQRILEDETFAQTLSQRGLTRSKLFSWSQCAQGHATLYRQFATK